MIKVTLVFVIPLLLLIGLFQIPEVEATPESIAVMAGVLLSLLFSFVPGFATWFQRLGENNPDDNGTLKRLVMLGLLFVTTLAIYLLANAGVIHVAGEVGIPEMIFYFILALIGNQGMFSITPKVGLNASHTEAG